MNTIYYLTICGLHLTVVPLIIYFHSYTLRGFFKLIKYFAMYTLTTIK